MAQSSKSDDEDRPIDVDLRSQEMVLPSLSTTKDGAQHNCGYTMPEDEPWESSLDNTPQRSMDKDIEKAESISGSADDMDGNLVTWEGPDDSTNPRNWTNQRKWIVTTAASGFSFISPLSSSMLSPALSMISQDLGIHSSAAEMLVTSIFVLGYAIGPLFMGPLSEIYGRVPVLRASNLFYLVFNTACGGCRTPVQMAIFRFLGGLGGSAPLAIGGGIMSDLWAIENRGKALGIYTLMPLLGPAIGPIAAGFIVQYSNWRWCFYSVTIAGCVIQALAFVFLVETNPRAILAKKALALRSATGNKHLYTEWDRPDERPATKLGIALKRPFKLLTTQPIVQFLGLYMAFLYGLMYLLLSTFANLWMERYHEGVAIGGLNYISTGLGFMVGSRANALLQDRVYRKLKATHGGGTARPEFRIPLMMPAAILVPIGIFVYAWTSEHTAFWLWPNVGVFIVTVGMIVCFQCMQVYIVETYSRYAASAIAATVVLRSLAGFGFPLFAPQMYDSLGYGWGNSLLGFIACGIGLPAVFIFWKYGQWLRERSPFAAGGD
ncbi:synaptic vesicle transporter [Xylariales sp. PMI_506]|nr:synaptic vesicle transporter [Xylariales sp. PMI_506]